MYIIEKFDFDFARKKMTVENMNEIFSQVFRDTEICDKKNNDFRRSHYIKTDKIEKILVEAKKAEGKCTTALFGEFSLVNVAKIILEKHQKNEFPIDFVYYVDKSPYRGRARKYAKSTTVCHVVQEDKKTKVKFTFDRQLV